MLRCANEFTQFLFTDYCRNAAGTQCNQVSTPARKKQYCDPNWPAGYNWMKAKCAKVCGIKCGKLIQKIKCETVKQSSN